MGRSFSCFSSGKGPVFQPLVGLHGTLSSWTVGVSGKAELLGRGPWAWAPSQFCILCPGKSDKPPGLSQSPSSSSARGGNVGPPVTGARPMSGGGEPLRAAPSLPVGRISTSQDGASSWSRSAGLGSLHHTWPPALAHRRPFTTRVEPTATHLLTEDKTRPQITNLSAQSGLLPQISDDYEQPSRHSPRNSLGGCCVVLSNKVMNGSARGCTRMHADAG